MNFRYGVLPIALLACSAARASAPELGYVEVGDAAVELSDQNNTYFNATTIAAGLAINPFFAVEAAGVIPWSQHQNGDDGGQSYTAELKPAFGLYLKGTFPASDQLLLDAKIGAAHMNYSTDYAEHCTTTSSETVCGASSSSTTGWGVSLGGGLRYRLTPNLSVTVDAMLLDATLGADVWSYGAGLHFGF